MTGLKLFDTVKEVEGAVDKVATAKHVKFVGAANTDIFRQSQYDNTVATVRVTDTTPRPKNEELPVKRTTSSVGRAEG